MMDWARRQATDLVEKMTTEEKIGLLSTHQVAIPRLHIPEFYIGGEAAHGIVDREHFHTTSFPIPLTLSQTWNPELLKKVGTTISDEARGLYNSTGKNRWLMPWAPTIDMERDPYWGRNEEGYGEDPYLTGKVAGGLINGLQQDDKKFIKVAAAPKHFFANNNEIGRGSTSNTITPTMKNEYYLRPFMFAFRDWHAQSMMTAYNGINGIPAMQSPELKYYVKGQWKMDGCIVTDGGALTLNVEEYHYYDNFADAVADALEKGIDCFVDELDTVTKAVNEALTRQIITESLIEQAITNTLTVRIRLGHLAEKTPYDYLSKNDVGTVEHDQLVQETYAEGTVLLKNKNHKLPLNEKTSILLTGPLADHFVRDWYATLPMNEETVYDGLKQLLGSRVKFVNSNDKVKLNLVQKRNADKVDQMTFEMERWQNHIVFLRDQATRRYLRYSEDNQLVLGNTDVYDWVVREAFYLDDQNQLFAINHQFNSDDVNSLQASGIIKPSLGQISVIEKGEKRLLELADQFDQVVFVGGNHPMINGRETEDRQSMELPKNQRNLLEVLHHSGASIIGVLLAGYPFIVDDLPVDALLFSGYAGQSMGIAIAKILLGRLKPTGHLSQTWFNSNWQHPAMNQYDIEKTHRTYQYCFPGDVQYPFGYGLTYGSLQIDRASLRQLDDRHSELTLNVSNHGDDQVTETVQVYLNAVHLQDRQNRNQLVAFKKIKIESHSEKRIQLAIDLSDATWFDAKRQKFYFPVGEYQLQVGFFAGDAQYQFAPKLKTSTSNYELVGEMPLAAFDESVNVALTSLKNRYELISLGHQGGVIYKHLTINSNEIFLRIFAKNAVKLSISIGDQTKVFEVVGDAKVQLVRVPVTVGADQCLTIKSDEPLLLMNISTRNEE